MPRTSTTVAPAQAIASIAIRAIRGGTKRVSSVPIDDAGDGRADEEPDVGDGDAGSPRSATETTLNTAKMICTLAAKRRCSHLSPTA